VKVGFLGYGDLGKQVDSFIDDIYNVDEKLFFDDLLNNDCDKKRPFIEHSSLQYNNYHFILALGYKSLNAKLKILKSIKSKQLKTLEVFHSSSYCGKNSRIGDYAIVFPHCSIGNNVSIGKGCVLNMGVNISHDCLIGDCCYFGPSVTLSGNCKIGDCCFIGSGVVIANGVSIGNNVKIGIGSVITSDIISNSNVIGNPMKFLNKELKL